MYSIMRKVKKRILGTVLNVHKLLNVWKDIGLGQIELGVEVSSARQNGTHTVLSGHLVEVARNVVRVHLWTHDVFAVFDEHGEAHEEQEGIVELGELVDELFFALLLVYCYILRCAAHWWGYVYYGDLFRYEWWASWACCRCCCCFSLLLMLLVWISVRQRMWYLNSCFISQLMFCFIWNVINSQILGLLK